MLVALFTSAALSGAAEAPLIRLVQGAIEVGGLDGNRIASVHDWEELLKVFVEREGDEIPPLVGRYEVEGGVVRFRPSFPFAPGMSYRAVLDLPKLEPGSEPLVVVLSIPRRDVKPSTRVTRLYPSADTLPENQLKLYFHFSAPMSRGDGLPFVRLLDDAGNVVEDPFLPIGAGFWDAERRRFTVFFDPGRVKRGILPNEQLGRPILSGNRYTLAVDSSWRDAEGLPLVAPFEKAFLAGPADETPIDPQTWRIHAPTAGTVEPLVVEFGEPLDRALLERSLSVTSPNGRRVSGAVEISNFESRWSFAPDLPWREGRYQLVVLTILEDLAGNQIGKPFEVDRFERIEGPVEETHRIPVVISPR